MAPGPEVAEGQQAPAVPAAAWRSAEARAIGCGRDHGREGGTIDETARRLSHEELAVAEQLASEGHQVRSLAAGRRGGRTPDLLVCRAPVEVKSWLSQVERGGVAPGSQSVANKLVQSEGQASLVVLNGRGTGLTAASAEAGMVAYAGLPHRARIASVRVLGDGFDLAWARRPSLGRYRDGQPDRHRGPEAGLGR
jgi:hypothetical protein